MTTSELRAAFEEARKIFSVVTDLAVWADLFIKDPVTGNPIPNPVNLPGYARKNEHTIGFNSVMARLSDRERIALALHWIPSLHPIQNDDLAITIASIACSDMNAATSHLKTIAAVIDPDPTNSDNSHAAVLQRMNAVRTKIADSLNLVKAPVMRYPQYYIDQIKGGVFGSGAAFVAFLQANWPVVKLTIIDRYKSVNKAIGKPADAISGTPATGLVAKTDSWAARMQAWADKAK